MMLIEQTEVPEAALPVGALKEHLRLGTGFSVDQLQDSVLIGFLRAAMAAIEGRISKILITRDFELTLRAWEDPVIQQLPVAPIQFINQVLLVETDGTTTPQADTTWRFEPDSVRPRLVGRSSLPALPSGGHVQIRFVAGYGAAFTDIPADLRQAVLMLAAHYYEYRDATSLADGCMPFGVTSLISRYRPIRLGLGA